MSKFRVHYTRLKDGINDSVEVMAKCPMDARKRARDVENDCTIKVKKVKAVS